MRVISPPCCGEGLPRGELATSPVAGDEVGTILEGGVALGGTTLLGLLDDMTWLGTMFGGGPPPYPAGNIPPLPPPPPGCPTTI